jgi:hypothetical protein
MGPGPASGIEQRILPLLPALFRLVLRVGLFCVAHKLDRVYLRTMEATTRTTKATKAFEIGRSDGIASAREDRTTVEQITRWYPGSPSDGLINTLGPKQCAEVLGVESLYGTGDRLTDAASEAIDDYDRGFLAGAREQALLNDGASEE